MQKLYTGKNCDMQIWKPKFILVTSYVISLNPVIIKYFGGGRGEDRKQCWISFGTEAMEGSGRSQRTD